MLPNKVITEGITRVLGIFDIITHKLPAHCKTYLKPRFSVKEK